MNRGEVWLADLGYVGKVRPVLVLSVAPGDQDRALVTYVIRTTSMRGTAYEVPHTARGMMPGAFDAQGLGTTDFSRFSRFIRLLASVDAKTMADVEDRVRAWLAL
jgi:mRNA-degrading endonuclease toxin of MazEF toxin-antitoxin module